MRSLVTGPGHQAAIIPDHEHLLRPGLRLEVRPGVFESEWKVTNFSESNTAVTRNFPIYASISIAATWLLAYGVLRAIQTGNDPQAKALLIGLGMLLYSAMLAATLVFADRRTLLGLPLTSRPEEIPEQALPVFVRIWGMGGSAGWLWNEGPRLCFRGYGFDFELYPSSFTRQPRFGSLASSTDFQALNALTERKPIRIAIVAATPETRSYLNGRMRRKALQQMVEDWFTEPEIDIKEVLLPPSRPPDIPERPLVIKDWIFPPLLMGSVLGATALLFPPLEPARLTLGGAGIGLFWPCARLLDRMGSKWAN